MCKAAIATRRVEHRCPASYATPAQMAHGLYKLETGNYQILRAGADPGARSGRALAIDVGDSEEKQRLATYEPYPP